MLYLVMPAALPEVGRCARAAGLFVGSFVGPVGAIASARALRNLLFEVAPTDLLALGLMSLVLLLTAGLAGYRRASRAARVDPVAALRSG